MLNSRVTPALWPGLALVSLVALAAAYYLLQPEGVSQFLLSLSNTRRWYLDFTDHYYATAQNIHAGQMEPSYGYFYSLFFGMCLSTTIGRLSPEAAIAVWNGFQFFSIILLLTPVIHFWRINRWLGVVYVGLLLFLEPLLHNLVWGQVSLFMTGSVLTSWMCYERGWKKTAIVLLALPTAIKYYTGIFLIYYLLKKDARFVVGVVAVAAALWAWPWFVYGWEANREFYAMQRLRLERAQAEWIEPWPESQYFPSVVNRLLEKYRGGTVPRRGLAILGYLLAVAALAVLWRASRYGHLAADLSLALLFLTLPLLIATCWPHYFVYLPFCQTAVLAQLTKSPREPLPFSSRQTALRAMLICLAIGSMFLSTMFCFQLSALYETDYITYYLLGALLWANLLLMPAVLVLLWRGLNEKNEHAAQASESESLP